MDFKKSNKGIFLLKAVEKDMIIFPGLSIKKLTINLMISYQSSQSRHTV